VHGFLIRRNVASVTLHLRGRAPTAVLTVCAIAPRIADQVVAPMECDSQLEYVLAVDLHVTKEKLY
jgi:hypothetical protein